MSHKTRSCQTAGSALVWHLAVELTKVRAERAALWQMLKDQTWAVLDLRAELAEAEAAWGEQESLIADIQWQIDQLHAERGCSE